MNDTIVVAWLNFAGICVVALATVIGAAVGLGNRTRINEVHGIVNSQRTAMELLIEQQRRQLTVQQQQLHDAGAVIPATDTGKGNG
jgi:hypothetical protein